MAFAQQTSDILCCFFDKSYLEVDSPGNGADPEKIAAKLRELGDHYDETVIQPLMCSVQKARSDQAGKVFSNSVDSLCNMWVTERPEVVREKHLLRATMALSLYMKRNCPDMTTYVWDSIENILNNRLGNWIMEQGGWERISNQ